MSPSYLRRCLPFYLFAGARCTAALVYEYGHLLDPRSRFVNAQRVCVWGQLREMRHGYAEQIDQGLVQLARVTQALLDNRLRVFRSTFFQCRDPRLPIARHNVRLLRWG